MMEIIASNVLTNILQVAIIIGIMIIYHIQKNRIEGLKEISSMIDLKKIKDYGSIIEDIAQKKLESLMDELKSERKYRMKLDEKKREEYWDLVEFIVDLLIRYSQFNRKELIETYVKNDENKNLLLRMIDKIKKVEDEVYTELIKESGK